MQPLLEDFARWRVIPVISLEDAEHIDPVCDALVRGGIPVVEITFRTEAALDAIRRAAARGDVTVGAGTVIDPDQARAAKDAGAAFAVSPGFMEDVVEGAASISLPIFPGVATPSECQRALRAGLEVLKFFPAEALGGLGTLSAMSAPFPGARFIPTGGIGPANLGSYLEHDRVVCCGGSWIAPKTLIQQGDYEEIARRARAVFD